MRKVIIVAIVLVSFILVLSGCEQKVENKPAEEVKEETPTKTVVGFWHIEGSDLILPEDWYVDVE